MADKVKVKVLADCVCNGSVWPAGDHDVSGEDAAALLNEKLAEPIEKPRGERATADKK